MMKNDYPIAALSESLLGCVSWMHVIELEEGCGYWAAAVDHFPI